MKRAAGAAFWTIPPLVCLAVYWPIFRIWFQQDDFAWLGLGLSIHGFGDLLRSLFAPMAQGTIRPLSERAFFLVLSGIFGIDPLPFRVVVVATQISNLVLLAAVVRRVSGSWVAGFTAPLFWTANAALSIPMFWASAYNQILCSFFLLAAFYLWIRYLETGHGKYLVAQWAAFLLGFGALEVNIVYPALAAAYALAFARSRLRQTIPMFAVSAAYFLVHSWAAPPESGGVYGLHFDLGVFRTLWTYCRWALVTPHAGPLTGIPEWQVTAGICLLTPALLGYVIWSAVGRKWLPVFFLGWFLIVLSPVLALPEHLADYYLAAPTVGLAVVMALAMDAAWRRREIAMMVALALAALYVWVGWPVIQLSSRWYLQRGGKIRNMVLGAVAARSLHPGRIILFTRMSNELFWGGYFDDPFRLFGVSDVFLAPGSEAAIEMHPELGDVMKSVLPESAVRVALRRDAVVIYDVSAKPIRNISGAYAQTALAAGKSALSSRILCAKPYFADQLKEGWYKPDPGFRWMARRATLVLPGPSRPGQRLRVSAYCTREILSQGPAHLKAYVDGQQIGTATLERYGALIDYDFPLPAALVGKERIDAALELDRAFYSPIDSRELGLAVSMVEIW